MPDALRPIAESERPLAPLTSWGIGGTAELLLSPRDTEELRAASMFASDHGEPPRVLGGGTNVLINDGPIRGAIISTSRLRGISIRPDGGRVIVVCGAGDSMKELFAISVREGWSGLEPLACVPGSVGGALMGNAGTKKGSVGTCVESVTTVSASGEVIEWGRDEMDWGYRRSPFADGSRGVIAGAVLALTPSDRESVRRAASEAARSRGSQPYSARTAGCVFKNPPGDAAGRLLDAAGCKGLSVGGAAVSERHANFFENRGGASAADILELARLCAERVRAAFGVSLEPEIRTIGLAEKTPFL